MLNTSQEGDKNPTNNSAGKIQQQDTGSAAPTVLSLAIKDLKVLYTAFMPFVVNGGLFIPTKKAFNMGDSMPLIISLMDDSTKYSINGKVIWITPNNAHNRTPGIGVQFMGENADALNKKIISILDQYTANKETTNTM